MEKVKVVVMVVNLDDVMKGGTEVDVPALCEGVICTMLDEFMNVAKVLGGATERV